MADNNQTVKNPYELNEPPAPVWLNDAINKWISKLDFVVLEEKLANKKDRMDTYYNAREFERSYVLEKIRKVLDINGVNIEIRAEYIAYGLELWKITKKFHPSKWKWRIDWERELKIIAQKWKNRGLNTSVMLEIAKVLNASDIGMFL